jgi:hypothetical protein
MFSPVVEARLRQRDAHRAEAKKQTEQESGETRTRVSPADLVARQRHIEACQYWQKVYADEATRKKAVQKNKDIKAMADIREAWAKPEHSATHRGQLVHQYGELYRRYVPATTDKMLLKAWQAEELNAMKKKVFEAINGTGKS